MKVETTGTHSGQATRLTRSDSIVVTLTFSNKVLKAFRVIVMDEFSRQKIVNILASISQSKKVTHM